MSMEHMVDGDGQDELLPLLRATADFDFQRLRGAATPWHVPVTEHLSVTFIQRDGTGALRYADPYELELELKLESLEADPLALGAACIRRRNATATTSFKPAAVPGTFLCQTDDGLDATRLLLVDEILALDLKGEPVAVVPHRNLLCVTGSEDREGLRFLLETATSALDTAHPISAFPVRLRNRRWETLVLNADHPLHNALTRLQHRDLRNLYGEQRQLLMEAFAQAGDETYVTPYETGRRDDGAPVSFCTWTGVVEGAHVASDLLLPETDLVLVVQVQDRSAEPRVGLVDAAEVRRVCASILAPTNHWPPRMRTLAFPSDAMIEALAELSPP